MIIRYLKDKGFFHLLSVNFLTQFLGFGSVLIVAKFLTPVEIGEIKIIQSYTALFILLAGFGYNASVLKFCSEKRSDIDKERILRFSLIRTSLTIILSLLIFAALAFAGVITSSRELSLWLFIYSAIVPFAVVTNILSVFLQALKKFKQMAHAQALVKGESFIVIVISTWLWGFPGFIFATIAAYIIGLIPMLSQVGLGFLTSGKTAVPNRFSHFAVFSMLGNGTAMIGQYSDIFILDHFSSDRVGIGYYALATIFILGAIQVTSTVQSISTPYFSERSDDESWFRRRLLYTQLRMAALSVIVSISIFLLAWLLVPRLYGPDYMPTIGYLLILLFKYIVWSSYAVLGVALFGLGFVRYNFIAVAIAAIVGIIVSYLLFQRIGIQGVAWGQVVSAIIAFCMTLFFVKMAFRQSFISR